MQQVGVGQRDPFGLAGRARGVQNSGNGVSPPRRANGIKAGP